MRAGETNYIPEDAFLEEDSLMHYGKGHLDGGHSGRYPWGSGEEPHQHQEGFDRIVKDLREKKFSDNEIAEYLGISSTEFRQRIAIGKYRARAALEAQALKYHDQGLGPTEIGRKMGLNESTVRNYLDPVLRERNAVLKNVADSLAEEVKNKKFVDVGPGSEFELGVTRTKLNTALTMLKDEGYQVIQVQVDQLGTDKKTTISVLCPAGTTYGDIVNNKGDIKPVGMYFEDGGAKTVTLEKPVSIDSKRIQIRYNEEGGIEKDGVIELRRGVDELSLGSNLYAQVRIGVDNTHYLKGMAVYSDDMPDGVDVIFNTNKHVGTPKMDVLKKMDKLPSETDSPGEVFGSTIKRQRKYIGEDGKEHLSPINIVKDEGDWSDWKRNLPSQFLAKQPIPLAKRQLNLDYLSKQEEFDAVMKLTNPAIKRKLLMSLADECDSAAVHLQAAALPRQAYHAILPVPDLKDNEVYAPNYRNGEKVALIRFPHAGTFEIPVLTVNNNHPSALKMMKNAKDAVGINSKVAEQLSGADFDGDAVLVIPTGNVNIRTLPRLKELVGFDPKEAYKGYEGMKVMKEVTKQKQMGVVSNLITDMTLAGAPPEHMARAVKHSMVVIDAVKHKLDWKRSEEENGIKELKQLYQMHPDGSYGGASTLISRAKSEVRVDERKRSYKPNAETGEWEYTYTGSYYIDKKGNKVMRQQKSTQMAEAKDAFTLSSGTQMEAAYATYANQMKALANKARKEYLAVESIPYSPSAKKTYAVEVASLNAKLNEALKNAPRERQAQVVANEIVNAQIAANPEMSNDKKKKIKGQALTEARARVGAKKTPVLITDREWEAIQAGAVSNNTLTKILNNTDDEAFRERATPRNSNALSSAKINLIKAKLDAGFTMQEVADAYGISTSTVSKYAKA